MKEKNYSLLEKLSSLKLTVILLFAITGLCLVGIVFPQEGRSALWGYGWGYHLLLLLGPYNIFHSIWFIGAGIVLCVNLFLCMRRRANPKKRSLLMHGSIFLIIFGYALGTFGLDGFVEIPEGESVSWITLADGSRKELGFTVKCDRFEVEYYDNGMPREYLSDLSFVRDGKVVGQASVTVNHPGKCSGIRFYQQSYRETVSSVIMAVSDGEKNTAATVRQGDIIPLLPDGTRAVVIKIRDDAMGMGPAVKLGIESPSGTRSMWVFRNIDMLRERMSNLSVMMPQFDPSGFPPYTFSITGVTGQEITGIGVKKDPGVVLAAAGGSLFLASLLLVCLRPRLGKRPVHNYRKREEVEI